MELNDASITIAGVGPGSADYVTPAARRAVEGADVLVGARRVLELFADSSAERVVMEASVDAVLAAIERARGRKVVVLVTGDPGLMSLARPIVARFGRAACRIIPGVSSVQAAFARLALDWQDAKIVDAHGALPELAPSEARSIANIAVLLGHAAASAWLVATAEALQPTHRIVVCRDLTLPTETVEPCAPADLASLSACPRAIVLFVDKEQFA